KEIPQCARLGSQSLISRAPAIDVRRTGNEVVLEACLVAVKEFERRPGGRELAVEVGLEKVVDDDVGDRVIDANGAGQATLDVRTNRALVDPAHDTHRIQCHCTERYNHEARSPPGSYPPSNARSRAPRPLCPQRARLFAILRACDRRTRTARLERFAGLWKTG